MSVRASSRKSRKRCALECRQSISTQGRWSEPSGRLTTLTPRPRSVPPLHPTRMSRAGPVLRSATSGAETEVKEMLPSPDLRMPGSGYIVLEVNGAEGRVAHPQEPRLRRQNRSNCCTSRVNVSTASWRTVVHSGGLRSCAHVLMLRPRLIVHCRPTSSDRPSHTVTNPPQSSCPPSEITMGGVSMLSSSKRPHHRISGSLGLTPPHRISGSRLGRLCTHPAPARPSAQPHSSTSLAARLWSICKERRGAGAVPGWIAILRPRSREVTHILLDATMDYVLRTQRDSRHARTCDNAYFPRLELAT